MYKLITPLKTRHVEPFAEYVNDNKVAEKSHPAQEAISVRKAVEFGWFDGDIPDVDEMLPVDVLKLSTEIWKAYYKAMGFDLPNLLSRRQTTPKA